jgi:hypothetical protein
MQRVPHLLGLGLEDLSHSQLDALDEMHTALLRAITEHRIKLVQKRERMMVEEAAAREHTKLQVAEQQQAELARGSKTDGDSSSSDKHGKNRVAQGEVRQQSSSAAEEAADAGKAAGRNGAGARARESTGRGRGRSRARGPARAKR